jgi:hypothetical protein
MNKSPYVLMSLINILMMSSSLVMSMDKFDLTCEELLRHGKKSIEYLKKVKSHPNILNPISEAELDDLYTRYNQLEDMVRESLSTSSSRVRDSRSRRPMRSCNGYWQAAINLDADNIEAGQKKLESALRFINQQNPGQGSLLRQQLHNMMPYGFDTVCPCCQSSEQRLEENKARALRLSQVGTGKKLPVPYKKVRFQIDGE